MAVVIEEFDINDMSFTVLGRVEGGEVIDDKTGFLSEHLDEEDLEDPSNLMDRFNGPRLIAHPDSRTLGKSWIPYEGPRGGEGWQNTEDPEEVVYQEDPPGEVADGYEEDHWDQYPSEGGLPDSPFGTPWKKPGGFGRSGGINYRDAVAFINYDDEIEVARVEEFDSEEKTYKLDNGYVIGHSQVVGYSEPEDGERLETSRGMVEVGDWIMYSDSEQYYNGQIRDIEINEGHDVITVVGEGGYKEIEVTGQSDNRSEYNAELLEVWDDTPGIFENVEENGMAMETPEIVGDITEKVDLTSEEESGEGRRGNDFTREQLSQEKKKKIRQELERYFPEQYVDSYYGAVESWKVYNADDTAAKHEQAFKEVLGIDSPTHIESLRDEEPPEIPEVHKRIAEVMAELSNEFWKKNFGGEARVHRGLSNTAFQQLFDSWLENPSASQYELKQLALNNYSSNREIAAGFGANTATVSLEADTDDVALCTDHISNIGTVEGEDEVQIHGDGHKVDSRNIRLLGNRGPSIGEHPEDWFREEHKAFGEFLTSWYLNKNDSTEEGPPLPESHYRTLREWSDALEENTDLMEENPQIRTIVEQIRKDAEIFYRFRKGRVEKSDETPTLDLTGESDATWMNDRSTPPQRETLSEELFEELVEQNNRRRRQMDTDTDDGERGPMRLKSRIEIDRLNKPDTNPVKDSTLEKAGENFEDVDDLLIDAWEKQVCADSLEKAPNMWRRGDAVPQFVRTFVTQAATKRDALWDTYNDVPHMAALKVHEIIKDNLTDSEGWSIKTISDDLLAEFEGIDERQAETIARTEVAAVLNKARAMAYEASEEDLQFYWSGPDDEHTTDLCDEVKEEIDSRGGYVDLDELQTILRRKARKYRDEGGTPERADSYLPHFQCRHTLVRSEFRWT